MINSRLRLSVFLEINTISDGKFSRHCYSWALKNASKFLIDFSHIFQNFKEDLIVKFFTQIISLATQLSRSDLNDIEEIDPFIRSLFNLVRAQIEHQGYPYNKTNFTVLDYLIELEPFLYQQFLRCYLKKEYNSAKTVFFYYVLSLEVTELSRKKEILGIIQEAIDRYLPHIFESTARESYVPYYCSDIEELTKEMVFSSYVDAYLFGLPSSI